MRFIIEANELMLNCALSDPQWCVIDTRSSDAYIGWTRPGEVRGGHLLNSVLFSAAWLDPVWKTYSNAVDAQLEQQMTLQGITPEKNIILYDENGQDADVVFRYLESKGFRKLFYFNLNQWTGDLVSYPKYWLLAPVWWVKALVDGECPPHYDGKGFKIFEVAWKKPSDRYLASHIPGAVHIDSNEFEVPPEWVKPSDQELIRFALNNGITPDTTVVVYGNDEILAAAKLSAVLRYLGVKNVFCMNGTLRNWEAAGYPTESGCPEKGPCTDTDVVFPIDRSHILNIQEAKAILSHPALGTLVDTRRWKNFIGEDSGYDYVPLAGRIPGARWCGFLSVGSYSGPDGTMSNADILLRAWERAGLPVRRKMAFFCGSASWGAAVVKLYGNIAGFDAATIYEGGWCEWQCDPNNPYETGIPEEWKDFDSSSIPAELGKSGGSCHSMLESGVTLI